MEDSDIQVGIKPRNIQRAMTFNRFLYAALEMEADRLNINITDVVNQELSKTFHETIRLLKKQEKNKSNE